MRHESEIMKNWKSNIEIPVVSICSITYNHAPYIRKAIEGFLMQKTDFPFEIIIDDDCSIDNTAEIIQEYSDNYPHIIKANLRKKNVGAKINGLENHRKAKGKYIAFCEGDDYWTDTNKLQYQIDKMKEHPECQISFHPAIVLDEETKNEIIQAEHFTKNTVVPIEEVIVGNGEYCPTASIIVAREIIANLPGFFQNTPVGDYFLQVYAAAEGGALYLNKTMCIYRIHSTGWTSQVQKDVTKYKVFTLAMVKSLLEFDTFFNHQYHVEFLSIIDEIVLGMLYQSHIEPTDKTALYRQCIALLSSEDRSIINNKMIQKLISMNHNLKNESIVWLEEQLENYKKSLADKEKGTNLLEEQLENHKKALSEKDEGTTWLEDQLENHKKALSEKDEGTTWLEDQLENHKKALSEKDEGTTWLEEQLENHKKALSEKEEKIREQGRSIVMRDDELNKYQNMLEMIDEKVFIMEQEYENKVLDLATKEQTIALLNQRLAYKETFKGLTRGMAKKIILKIKRFF